MPMVTRRKEALALAFKTPLPTTSSLPQPVTTGIPTPTSLSPPSSESVCRGGGKRLRLSSCPSTLSTTRTIRKTSASSSDSWQRRRRPSGRLPHQQPQASVDPHRLGQFMDGLVGKREPLKATAQLEHLKQVELEYSWKQMAFASPPITTSQHFDFLLAMTKIKSGEAPHNTAFIALHLLCRYLTVIHQERISNGKSKLAIVKATQEALLTASCLLAFKLAEEVDLDVDECIKMFRLSCSRRQVLASERKICNALKWHLNCTVTVDEAVHAVLDSADPEGHLGVAEKALVVKCCQEAVLEAVFEFECGVLEATVAAVEAMFCSMNNKLRRGFLNSKTSEPVWNKMTDCFDSYKHE